MTPSPQHLSKKNQQDSARDLAIETTVVTLEAETVVGENSQKAVDSTSQTIDVAPTADVEVTRQDPAQNGQSPHPQPPPQSPQPQSGALVTRQGSFGAYLAPLTKDGFKEAVSGVHQKLEVMSNTLSLLDNLLDAQGFDAILDDMLRSITLKTGELLNADRTTIFLLDEEKHELWAIVAKDELGNNLELRIPANVGIAGEVASSKEKVKIDYDFYDDPRSEAAKKFDQKNHYRTYTMLALPLLNEDGKLVAVVQLLNKLKPNYDFQGTLEEKIDKQGFTDNDEQVFEEFAPSIRLIIEASRSFYRATQRQRAASALMNAVKSLSKGSLDLEETLKNVMHQAKELMQADRSTLWLIDEERQQLWTKLPLLNGELKELRIPRNAGFAGQVAASGEPLLIPFDLYNHPNSQTSKDTDLTTGYRTCSMLCMPVFNADNVLIGVTQLINKLKQGEYPEYDPVNYPEAPDRWKASFNQSDQEFMQAFNIQAGVALQNAKLFETVKQQEQMQKDILRSLSNGVISTDKNGNIIAVNESAKELLGLDEDTALEGIHIQKIISLKKGDFDRWTGNALEAKDEKSREQYYPDQTLECMGDSTEEHSINLSINTITDAKDRAKASGILVVMEDISDEKRLKSTMYRYMTQELAEQLLENPDAAKMGGDRKAVSVLFSDIRSYTNLTENLKAEQVVEMLNEYFESMVDAVFSFKGTLDKYIGDAIMAVFGSPLPLDDHEWMAVQSALEMRQRLVDFNIKRTEKNQDIIRIGIGINSDTVISGNIGSSKRMEFTAIGDGVNLGSRLESASKIYGTDIIISGRTYKPCASRIRARELDYIRVKGKDQPVEVYELIGYQDDVISDKQQRLIDHYHKGRDYFKKRDFPMAMAEFGQVLSLDKENKAANLHLDRCQKCLQEPPKDDWDGSWTLTEK
jgi:adenylate cyclase